MKTTNLQRWLTVMSIVVLASFASTALSEDSPAANKTLSAATNAPEPRLSYGVSQIVRLTQANLGEDTIIAFINYAETGYVLDVNQIIYLRQRGVSEPIIQAMLNHPKIVDIT